jgi:hypothetical protein
VHGRLLVRTGPGLTPVCRATTFLIQPDVKSQPPEERLMWLTARGRRIPRGRHLARLVGSPAPGIRRPPSGRCWERPTIDLGKAPPTLAALQRQIAHRDCAWRSPTQPSTSACVTAQEPVLHQGHDPGTRYGPRRIHVLTVPGGRSSVWSQRSRAPGRLNRTGPEAQWSALGPQYTGSPGYSAGTNGHDRSAKPTARRTPHVDDLGRCRNPTAGSNPP